MAKYITVAPNGINVTVSHAYGSKTFAHGEIIDNDKLAVIFPSVFKKLPENNSVVEKVQDFVEEVIEAVKDEVETVKENVADFVEDVSELLEHPEAAIPVKKKAGRPAGSKSKAKVPKKPAKKKE